MFFLILLRLWFFLSLYHGVFAVRSVRMSLLLLKLSPFHPINLLFDGEPLLLSLQFGNAMINHAVRMALRTVRRKGHRATP